MRTIDVGTKFLVDGVHCERDGSGRIFYAVQMDDPATHIKYCMVFLEAAAGVLTPVLRDDRMIGAPHICRRPDGTAYVVGGGKNNQIIISDSIPGFIPRIP